MFAPLSATLAAATPIAWWVWLLIIILILLLILLLWWLFRKDRGEISSPVEQIHETPHPVETRAAGLPVTPDDLKIVEGIGPKIEKLLNAAGIFTFSDLASTPVSRLAEIMKAANLRISDPTTWPEQARLAAEGKLDALKDYQDKLKGGRVV
jgi:predicted flap endonuclease-1-like 5' DNA nuclease